MSRFLLVLVIALASAAPAAARAQPEGPPTRFEQRLGARVAGYAAMFAGGQQIDRMKFDRPALLADAQLSVLVLPWLSAELGAFGGLFWASDGLDKGGLLAPVAGLRFHGRSRRLAPFFALDAGAGFTGELVRPLLRVRAGADLALGRGFSIGPVLGYGHLFQWNGPSYSTDARFLLGGLSISYRAFVPAPPPERTRVVERVEERVIVQREPAREPVNQVELLNLIEGALPSPKQEMELLAPVLFAFDSDELEPIGVAMLHEVARLLGERTDIQLVAVRGYADRRGGEAYNRALSERRARRVIEWLTAHGVAPERLVIDPQGASAFVEQGESEGEHQQNRRVVFRVLRTEEP